MSRPPLRSCDLLEVAVRPRHQQLVLDRSPEALAQHERRRGRRARTWSPKNALPDLLLGLDVGTGRDDAERPHRGVRVGVALEQVLDGVLVVVAERGAAHRPPARPGRGRRRRRPRSSSRSARRSRRTRPGCAAPPAGASGSLDEPGGGVGEPAPAAGRLSGRRAQLVGGAAGPDARNGSTSAGAASRSQHAEQRSRARRAVRQLALEQHVPGGATATSARTSGSGSAGGSGRACGPQRRASVRTAAKVRSPSLTQVQVAVGQRRPRCAVPGDLDRGADPTRRELRRRRVVGADVEAVRARLRRRRAVATTSSPPSQRRACRCRPGRARPRSSRQVAAGGRADARHQVVEAGVAPGVVAEVGPQALDEGLLADVGHQLVEHAWPLT